MARPAFQIVEIYPTYCPHTDGLTGSVSRIVRYCETEGFARKIAGVMEQRDFDGCGDSSFRAMPLGRLDGYLSYPQPTPCADDFPF
jgi:hypothetical protein